MHEQIALNGAPVAGFGALADTASEKAFYGGALIGYLVGSVGGAYIGHAITKGVIGTAIGTVAGGGLGAHIGVLVATKAIK